MSAAKRLNDRKGSFLSGEEQRRCCRVVTALAETMKLQAEVDALYPAAEKETIEFPEFRERSPLGDAGSQT